MSCRHKRQSKEMDSENAATSAPGPEAKRPLRDTGDFFVIKAAGICGETAAKSRAKLEWFYLEHKESGANSRFIWLNGNLPEW